MIVFLAISAFAFVVLRGSGLSYAEEVYKNFSLGYGSLNPGATDAKAPSPCALTAKYGFSFAKDFQPYVGTGLAYSIPPEIKPGDTMQRIKTGVAGQAGFKFRLDENSLLRFDYKYLHLEPDLLHGNSCPSPQSLGVGVDVKF